MLSCLLAPAASLLCNAGELRHVSSRQFALRIGTPPAACAASSPSSDPEDCAAVYGAVLEADARQLLADESEVGELMSSYGFAADRPDALPERGVFCTRALDMRSIKAIGYDMDYTLIDYKMELFEERVFEYSKSTLLRKGFPVADLIFNHDLVTRGLIIDTELGHVIKVDRFGYVRRAMHGAEKMLSREEIARDYGLLPPVDLREPRWVFLNTLFSVSEGCLYAQLVDRLDSGRLLTESREPFDASKCSTYEQLYRAVSKALFKAHVQGRMKEEIMSDPLRFINVDPAYTQTLLDQRASGKKARAPLSCRTPAFLLLTSHPSVYPTALLAIRTALLCRASEHSDAARAAAPAWCFHRRAVFLLRISLRDVSSRRAPNACPLPLLTARSHHQLGLGLHEHDDARHVRAVSARVDAVVRPLRRRRRLRVQARVLR